MEEKINLLRQKLSARFQKPLPGHEIQYKMAMKGREQKVKAWEANKKNARLSAVLIMLYYKEGQLHLPLIRRPQYEGVHGGQMALPGGRKEEIDISLAHTAMRETLEEVGVIVTEENIIGSLTELYIPPSQSLVSPYLSILSQAPSFTIDPGEVDRVFEMPVADFFDEHKLMTRPVTVMGNMKLQVPAFYIKEQTVWGATAMMMNELLYILKEIEALPYLRL